MYEISEINSFDDFFGFMLFVGIPALIFLFEICNRKKVEALYDRDRWWKKFLAYLMAILTTISLANVYSYGTYHNPIPFLLGFMVITMEVFYFIVTLKVAIKKLRNKHN